MHLKLKCFIYITLSIVANCQARYNENEASGTDRELQDILDSHAPHKPMLGNNDPTVCKSNSYILSFKRKNNLRISVMGLADKNA